jgi:hypothetical protein
MLGPALRVLKKWQGAIRDADTALLEAGEEPAPVDFRLGEGATDSEDHALAVVTTTSTKP